MASGYQMKRSWSRCVLRWSKRLVVAVLLIVVLYFGIVLIGLVPVNNDFAPAADGITVHVASNAVHADIVLPIESDVIDWREHFPAHCFRGDTSHATHVAIGWGDRRFYVETPTWADLRLSTALNALFIPSDTCLHVSLFNADYLTGDARSVDITREQYQRLTEFIMATFRSAPDGRFVQIRGESYGANDAFFEANGSYNCVNTCNAWAGRGLKSAGVRTPWLTPLPKTVFLYLPD